MSNIYLVMSAVVLGSQLDNPLLTHLKTGPASAHADAEGFMGSNT